MTQQPPPVVSVIIPTRDRALLVQRAIKSVLQQTYPHLEVIVVDDASSDDTVQELRKIRDPRLRIIPLATNQGAGIARNVGIQEARGEYVSFLDSDDEWLPRYLEEVLAVFESRSNSTNVVRSDALLQFEGHEQVRTVAAGDIFTPLLFCREAPVFSTLTIRASALVGGPRFSQTLWFPDDRAFLLELARESLVERVGESLVIVHREHDDHMNSTQSSAAIRRDFLSRYKDEFSPYPTEYQRLLVSLGRVLWRSGDKQAALNVYSDAVKADKYRPQGFLAVGAAVARSVAGDLAAGIKTWRNSPPDRANT